MPGDDPGGRAWTLSRRQLLGAGLVGAGGALLIDPPASVAAPGGPGRPTNLVVDGLADPIGLDLDDVYFGWHVVDGRRGARQEAYRVVVTQVSPAGGARPVWDSGRVASAEQAFIPYAGRPLVADAAYRWTVQTWSASGRPGPFAHPGRFGTGLTDADWKALWIRRPADDQADTDQYTYARTEFTLGRSPVVRARAYVSGDQQYELSVNGTRAGKGQAYSFPDAMYYETLDVTELLAPGRANAVGVLTNWQGATKGHPDGVPGAIVQISVHHADGTTALITTDGSWRVLAGAWLPGTQRDLEGDLVDHTENVNGPAIPVGWDRPGFDDSAWAAATVLGPAGTAPWTHLVAVRTRTVEEPVAAVSLTRLSSGAVVADFGRVYAAVPTVRFHHGVAGRTITMRAGYLLDHPEPGQASGGEPGQVSTLHGTQHTDMSYSYVQRGGVEEFHPFDYLGFRYFQIDDPGEALTTADVVALTRHTAVPDEHAGRFSSSHGAVDAIFELGRHSALFCAQEQFIDTPTREKGPWLWDGYNESVTAMATLADQNLTRKSLLEFAQSQARFWPNGAVNKIYPTGLGALDINEFTEIYPEWVWQYWMATGDRPLLEAVYPVMANVAGYVAAALDPTTGLVTSLPATNVYYPFPVVTRMNVLGANVFFRTAQAATALGRPAGEVSLQRQRLVSLTTALNARLTRPDGVYVDGLDATGAQVPTASQDTNACALTYGPSTVPVARQGAVAAYVASLGMQAPPRTAYEVLVALSKVGGQAVVGRLTDATSDGWANILARGATFTWEVWQPSDANGDSMSHGWGANAALAIQQLLLGVRPAAPGWSRFTVAPPATGLAWARGTVPTPRGTVAVHWSASSGRRRTIALDLSVPPNAAAVVVLPAGAPASVTEGGRRVPGPGASAAGVTTLAMGGGQARLAVGAGEYHFTSTGSTGPAVPAG